MDEGGKRDGMMGGRRIEGKNFQGCLHVEHTHVCTYLTRAVVEIVPIAVGVFSKGSVVPSP